MICTRCEGTGFLNAGQLEEMGLDLDVAGSAAALEWIAGRGDHDVAVCDCCGDGEGWYGEPGEHGRVGAVWDTPGVPNCI